MKEGDWDVDAGDYEALLTTILGENKKPVFLKKKTWLFIKHAVLFILMRKKDSMGYCR